MAWLQLNPDGSTAGVSAHENDMTQGQFIGQTQVQVADDDARIVAFAAKQRVASAPPSPRPTPLQWLRRLTIDKQQAIFATAATNAVVLGWLFEADGAGGGIDVTDPLTAQGVAAIAAAVPVITANDQALLLAP